MVKQTEHQMKRYSHSFQFTVDPKSAKDMESLTLLRKEVKAMNKMSRDNKHYVKCQGRWGKNNSFVDTKRKYFGGSSRLYQHCPLACSVRWDVYVYRR